MGKYSFKMEHVFNIFEAGILNDMIKKYNIKEYHYLNQIHSDIIHIVSDDYKNGTDGDALIINRKNTALIVRTADCIPTIIYDDKKKILGVVHSGWKGTLKGIVVKTIKKMIANYDCNVNDIKVYLYPSIRDCHFLVDEDVYLLFKDKFDNIDDYSYFKDSKYHIDLQGIVIKELKEIGIKEINDSGICTYCNHMEYYSYRYDRTNKRNYLIAYMEDNNESN